MNLDMARTSVNVWGDCVCAAVVDKIFENDKVICWW